MKSKSSRRRLEKQIQLWQAINTYAEACGGDTGAATVSARRIAAVVAVEKVIFGK